MEELAWSILQKVGFDSGVGRVLMSPLRISADTLLKPIMIVLFTFVLSLTQLLWWLNEILLVLAYMLFNLRTFLVMRVFSAVLDIFIGPSGTLVGIIRASFLLAIMVLGITLIARSFFRINIVNPEKLFMWGAVTVMLLGTGAASSAYQAIEGFREDLSNGVYQAVFGTFLDNPEELAQAFTMEGAPPPHAYGTKEAGGIATLVGFPEMNDRSNIRGYNVAGAFVRATMLDVLEPRFSIPSRYDELRGLAGESFRAVYWNDQGPTSLGNLDDPERTEAFLLAVEGLIRMLLGIIPCFLALLEAVILFCLTVSTGVIFCTIPVGLIFAFFEPTEPMITSLLKLYSQIFIKTMVINVLLGLVMLLLMAGAVLNNGVVFVGVAVIGVLFGVSFAEDSFRTISSSLQAFSTSAGQVMGMKGGAMGAGIPGLVGGVGRMAASGAMALTSGQGGWAAAGAALGSNQGIYKAMAMGEGLGLFGQKPGQRLGSILQGSRVAGMTGNPLSPVAMTMWHGLRQRTVAESAGKKYEQAFAQYQEQLTAQRELFQAGQIAEPEFDVQAREYAEGTREEPPELPANLQALRDKVDTALDRKFMMGVPGRAGVLPSKPETVTRLPDAGTLLTPEQREAMKRRSQGGPGKGGEGEAGAGGPPGGTPSGQGPLGGRILGSRNSVTGPEVADNLVNDQAVTVAPDGTVEALPYAQLEAQGLAPDTIEPGNFIPVDQVADPADYVRQGWSVAMDKDHTGYMLWQQQYPDGVVAGGDTATIRSEARRGLTELQPGRAGATPGAPGSPRATAAADAAADVPAIPLGGEAGAAGGINSRKMPIGLAAAVRRSFEHPSAPRPGDRAQQVEETTAAVRKDLAEHGWSAEDLAAPAAGQALETLVGESFDQMGSSQYAWEGEGLNPEYADYMRQHMGLARDSNGYDMPLYHRKRAEATAALPALEQEVGLTPEADREVQARAKMGRLANLPVAPDIQRAIAAPFQDPDLVSPAMLQPIERLGSEPPGLGAPPNTQPETFTTAGVQVARHDVAGAVGQVVHAAYSREAAIEALEAEVGVAAPEVYECLERHDGEQALSVVGTTQDIVRTLRATHKMTDSQIIDTVYTPDGQDIRPEFREAVIARAQDGASSFAASEQGQEDLDLLIAASLGADKTVTSEGLFDAVARSAVTPGPRGAGAEDVAARLHLPSDRLENAGPAIQGFTELAAAYEVPVEETTQLLQHLGAGKDSPELDAQLLDRFRATGAPEDKAQQALRTMRGYGRSISRAKVKGPRTFHPGV